MHSSSETDLCPTSGIRGVFSLFALNITEISQPSRVMSYVNVPRILTIMDLCGVRHP